MKSVKFGLLCFSLTLNVYFLCVAFNALEDTPSAPVLANFKTPITHSAGADSSLAMNTSTSSDKKLVPEVDSRITLPLSLIDQIPAFSYTRFLGPNGCSFTHDAGVMLGVNKSVELLVTQALTQLAEECSSIESKWAVVSQATGEATDRTATLVVDKRADQFLQYAVEACRQRVGQFLPEPKTNLIIKEGAALLKVNDLKIERIYQISSKESADLIRLSPTEELQKLTTISLSSSTLRFTKNGNIQSFNGDPRWSWIVDFLKP